MKHEYRKVVIRWTFLIGTVLFPIIALCFAFVPALIFSIGSNATKLVIVDRSGVIAPRVKESLSDENIGEKLTHSDENIADRMTQTQNERVMQSSKKSAGTFIFVDYPIEGKTDDQIRSELTAMTAAKEIDAFIIVPSDPNGEYQFLSRKAGDFVASGLIDDAVNNAVRAQRLVNANISEGTLRRINEKVTIDAKAIDDQGREKDSDAVLGASFVVGLMIYLSLAIFGQVMMAAVVEEKETRIAEVLFSSASPFELMMGKLVGVGLAGLTQLGIWLISLSALIGFLALQTDLSPILDKLPNISVLMVFYFLVFFLLGYFLFASIFALIGSTVTTVQEGGQFAMLPVMLMLIGFYMSFAVIRDPSSPLAFWASVAPFFAPISMPVRILAETPPFWQIVLSMGTNLAAIAFMIWLTSRVYRIGMLMYGKRATIPEIWKWIRQA